MFTFVVLYNIRQMTTNLWEWVGWKETGAGLGGDGLECVWDRVRVDLMCAGMGLKYQPRTDL